MDTVELIGKPSVWYFTVFEAKKPAVGLEPTTGGLRSRNSIVKNPAGPRHNM
jgi:hypothetical protein